MKQEILKLNANYFPIAIANWKNVMVDIISGAVFPVDVSYETDESGKINKDKIEWISVIRNIKDWENLPIREFDEYVNTPKTTYRLPSMVICANYNKIMHKKVLFPTKANIWKRDNYICQYTGKKLTKENLSVDHVLPSSRGGKNTWENLVTCDKQLNSWKSDRTPKECNLKLLAKPTKPSNGMVFSFMREEWEMFVDSGEFKG